MTNLPEQYDVNLYWNVERDEYRALAYEYDAVDPAFPDPFALFSPAIPEDAVLSGPDYWYSEGDIPLWLYEQMLVAMAHQTD